jgi:hypothetical protein
MSDSRFIPDVSKSETILLVPVAGDKAGFGHGTANIESGATGNRRKRRACEFLETYAFEAGPAQDPKMRGQARDGQRRGGGAGSRQADRPLLAGGASQTAMHALRRISRAAGVKVLRRPHGPGHQYPAAEAMESRWEWASGRDRVREILLPCTSRASILRLCRN